MTGQTVTGGREQVCVDQATEDQAAALGIDACAAVMLTRTWYMVEDGSPIEYSEAVRLAGHWLSHVSRVITELAVLDVAGPPFTWLSWRPG
jgi:hypothetical protein